MVRKHITWILVADGAHARVLVNEGVGKGVSEVPGSTFEGSRALDQDIQADRPGRTFDSHGEGRHAKEPRTDPKQHGEREFIRAVVDWVAGQAHAERFDRLVLIAAPHALGDLRSLLPKTLAARVTAEIPKNLAKATPADIENHLTEVMAV